MSITSTGALALIVVFFLIGALAGLYRLISRRLEKSETDIRDELSANRKESSESIDRLRDALNLNISTFSAGADRKLELMRSNIDARLGRELAERLESIHRGFGQVGALNKSLESIRNIFSNISTRGALGETRLRAILEDILAPDQFEENFQVKDGRERVEFAVKISDLTGAARYLPVDVKFPVEDYRRLQELDSDASKEIVAKTKKALIDTLLGEAKKISAKYIEPPKTTDFAILFLPSNGLYNFALDQPDLLERANRDFNVVITGPSTFGAILNLLRMIRTDLAVESKTKLITPLFNEIRKEVALFAEATQKARDNLRTADNAIAAIERRIRVFGSKLAQIEK